MSKLLGIDYGSKRVGVAVSDERGAIAFPRATFPNDKNLIPALAELIKKESVATVIVGDSRNAHGTDNPIMADIRRFAGDLEWETGAVIYFEPEFYTSVEARRSAGKHLVDAEAAAIILNSYIMRTAP